MNQVTIHLLSTIAYRFNKSIRYADADFATLSIGHGVRSPLGILFHMNQVLAYARFMITGQERQNRQMETWQQELDRFNAIISSLQSTLNKEPLSWELKKRIIQGPFSDVLTHIGQLAMLSRFNDNPIPGENFSRADI